MLIYAALLVALRAALHAALFAALLAALVYLRMGERACTRATPDTRSCARPMTCENIVKMKYQKKN
jgi:hypothetical protein